MLSIHIYRRIIKYKYIYKDNFPKFDVVKACVLFSTFNATDFEPFSVVVVGHTIHEIENLLFIEFAASSIF